MHPLESLAGKVQYRKTYPKIQHTVWVFSYLCYKTSGKPANDSRLHHKMNDISCRMCNICCPCSTLKEMDIFIMQVSVVQINGCAAQECNQVHWRNISSGTWECPWKWIFAFVTISTILSGSVTLFEIL